MHLFDASLDHVYATLLSLVVVALCITVHYEVLNLLAKVIHRPERHRWQIMMMMYGLLGAHVLEIWIFGLGHFAAVDWFELGHIAGAEDRFFDYVYFAAMVYTTVGFGDMVPVGAIRMLSSTAAVSGLSLITWSASFTFLQMQRYWRR
jgi:hypothetical protein